MSILNRHTTVEFIIHPRCSRYRMATTRAYPGKVHYVEP
nr:MAG TPA: hypothetical protein [Caudoviricetes sp.]